MVFWLYSNKMFTVKYHLKHLPQQLANNNNNKKKQDIVVLIGKVAFLMP